ncbi:MAG: small ribosomal subunit Rsm22 family protein [Oscillochloridaceae bacterium umkhey_bin13]
MATHFELPNSLRIGLDQAVRGSNPEALARRATELSAGYRAGQPLPLRTPDAALAYAITRMPATFAAIAAAMAATQASVPAFAPHQLLDVGAGTGAALWAATTIWPTLHNATLLEQSAVMRALGQRFAAKGQGAVAAAQWQASDVTAAWQAPPHDLVSCAYLLGELTPADQAVLITRLWAQTRGVLLLIEPGTPQGWSVIRAAREQLRSAGATLAAPCPHAETCPLSDPDWCHFSQRLARSSSHRAAKGADRSYEDEKFSYLAVSRDPVQPAAARVLRHPLIQPGRISLQLCTPDGLATRTITRSEREAWPLARDLRWGAALPLELLDKTKFP